MGCGADHECFLHQVVALRWQAGRTTMLTNFASIFPYWDMMFGTHK